MTTALINAVSHVQADHARAAPDRRQPLRVCYLIDDLAQAGTEMQLLALIRHLDRTRMRPYLVLLRGDAAHSRALEPEGCPVLRLGIGALRSPRAAVQAWRFTRFLREERIDVLQVYFPDSSYFGVPLAWLAGVRHRIRTRNNVGHWLTPLHRRLGRLLNYFATTTVTNCAAARAALLEDESPSPDQVVVLENGTDLDRFLALPPAPASPRRVGAVANLRPVKGLDVFLEAARRLAPRHPDVAFTVAGEGTCRERLERAAAEAALADRFLLPGAVADVPIFLAGLHVAVLSSHAEGMSNALLEYMAAARPIVATTVGAAADLLVDGVHGLLVPPGDAAGLARAIDRLLRDPDLGRRLGEAARRRAQHQFSRSAMVRRFEEFYEALHEGKAKAPPANRQRADAKRA